MVMFFKADPTVKAPPSCGGNEEMMTNPEN